MGMILSFTSASANSQSFVENASPRISNSVGNGGSANQANYWRVRVPGDKPMTLTQATWYNGAVAGNVDAGIGTISGTSFTLLASTGSTAMSGANARQTANLTSSVTLYPDRDYYLAFVCSDVATATFGRFTFVAAWAANIDGYFKGSALPLVSATVAAGSNGITVMPWLRLI